MPQYKYRCTVCQHEFEDIIGVNEPNPPCPATHQLTDAERSARLLEQGIPTFEVPERCFGVSERIPSLPGPPVGGSTPKFYR